MVHWKRWRHWLEWLGLRGLAHLVPALPRGFWQRIADVTGFAAPQIHRPGRAIALANLATVFPEKSASERATLVRQSYQYFERAMGDLFWSGRLTRENVEQYLDLSALEQLRAERGDRGLIFACLHYGGFEWIALALGLRGFPCTVVTQKFKNPLLNRTFNQLRELSGHQTIRREGAILRLYKALQAGRSVTLAVDLTVPAKLPSVPIECFGLKTCVTFAHAFLHQRTGAPIIPTYCEPLPDGRYRLVLRPALSFPPEATHQEIAQACWNEFEPVIRANPAPWLWMYKHWRYRPDGATQTYPAYANRSPHFEKLLRRMEKEEAGRVIAAPPVTG